MSYNGGLSQEELERRSESVASGVFSVLADMDKYFEKVASWADGRTNAELAQWILDTDKDLDTTRFPTVVEVEAFVSDLRALAVAFNTINTSVSANDRADIVKFI